MTPALLLALVAVLQQPAPAAGPPVRVAELLEAARGQIDANRLDSAAVLLRRVTVAPEAAASERMEAWVLLGIVSFYTSEDSAAAAAFRAALALDPGLQVDDLDTAIASILERERAALARAAPPPPALPPVPPAPAAGAEPYDCVGKCPEGVEPPRFSFFPRLEFADASVRGSRRMRTYLTFRAVITANGTIDPGTLQVSGGTARGTEPQLRRGLAQARFEPGRAGGLPVATIVTLRFDFTAEGTAWITYTYRVVGQ